MMVTPTPYPASFAVDYPVRALDRLTTLFRVFTVIPIAIVLGLLTGSGGRQEGASGVDLQVAAPGILFLPTLLMLVFRQKYPRWWFDWNLALSRFGYRVVVYLALLRDEYPSTDEGQAVHLDAPYPDAQRELNRWLPLVKWLLALPHYVVLVFLALASIVCVVIAWFAILFTGGYPRGLFDFVVGVLRWSWRVSAYAFLLLTDQYPPFRLSE
jgi:hypothetical protein